MNGNSVLIYLSLEQAKPLFVDLGIHRSSSLPVLKGYRRGSPVHRFKALQLQRDLIVAYSEHAAEQVSS